MLLLLLQIVGGVVIALALLSQVITNVQGGDAVRTHRIQEVIITTDKLV